LEVPIGNHNSSFEERQTAQWSKEKGQKDKQREHAGKDATDTQKCTSYHDRHLDIDNEGRIKKNSTTNVMTS
jgi:hypothetical protein